MEDNMSTRALSEEEGTDTRTGALSEEGEQTGSQLRLPDGHLGTFETKQGACVADREQPGPVHQQAGIRNQRPRQ